MPRSDTIDINPRFSCILFHCKDNNYNIFDNTKHTTLALDTFN